MLDYEHLSDPERAVWDAIETGEPVGLPLGAPADDDPATGQIWAEDRQISGQLLYELLAGVSGPRDVRPRALELTGARITGPLNLAAIDFVCPLRLTCCSFEQHVNLEEARAPALRLPGCHLPALNARQFHTRGNLELDKGFTVLGEVNLAGAQIGGDLCLQGACVTNKGGSALTAGGITTGRSVGCSDRFGGQGGIRLGGAHIKGDVLLQGASLTNGCGPALSADCITVDRSMKCTEVSTEGEISLVRARITGVLTFEDAELSNTRGPAINLEQARAGHLVLSPLRKAPAEVDLSYAHFGVLVDDPASGPRKRRLLGLVYDALGEKPPVAVDSRLDWLGRQLDGNPQHYSPQPYEQLASVYRRVGRDEDARKVEVENQRHRRQVLKGPGRVWNTLMCWTVGYGYQTWKAGIWLLALVLLGWRIFDRAHPAYLIAAKPPAQRPWFHAGLYTLDLLLPFADLGYQSAWVAAGWARWFYLGWNLAGWVLITAVVAGLSGLIKRD